MAQEITPSSPETSVRPWIIGAWPDLVFFIFTPLLALVLIGALQTRMSITQLGFYVAAFGALGHHLPGMMRAYGDVELFQRFRTRLILAPIVLLAAVIWSTHYNLDAVTIVLLLWGLWHGMMQVFGFCRIYDAKYKSFDPWTARLDWWMCLTWFTMGVVWSPARMGLLLGTWNMASGGLMLDPGWLGTLRWGWAGLTAVVTVAFMIHTGQKMASGARPSPVKLLNMFTSFAFWIYVSLMVDHIVLGVALFEVFHDVQYLAIVWVYNRARVDRGTGGAGGGNVGSFTRFLFRRSGLMIGLYLGLIFGYGALYPLAESLSEGTLRSVLISSLATSTLFHFYLDGFIWKVREQSTRKSFSLDESQQSIKSATPPWLVHGAKWSFFLVPVLLLGVVQLAARDQSSVGAASAVASSWTSQAMRGVTTRDSRAQLQYASYLARVYPESWNAHAELASSLMVLGEHEKAEHALRRAVEFYPYDAKLQNALGSSLILQGRSDQAQPAIEAALDLDPKLAEAHSNFGVIEANRGNMAKASKHFAQALELDADYVQALVGMADVYRSQKQYARAADHLRRAVAIDPNSFDAQVNLGITLGMLQDYKNALVRLQKASRLKPEDPLSYLEGGILLIKTRKFEEAFKLLTKAVQPSPLQVKAIFYQGVALEALGRQEDAIKTYQRAIKLAQTQAQAAAIRQRLEAIGGRQIDVQPVP